MSPSNKLKLADDGDTNKLIKLKGDEAKTYKLTKALGIKYCYAMIKPFPEWTGLLDSAKKKDDLADALLQGLKYLDIEYINDETSKQIIENLQETKKVISRKPTEKQLSKRNGLSKSNIKYLLCEYKKHNPESNIHEYICSNNKIHYSIIKQYNSIDECLLFL